MNISAHPGVSCIADQVLQLFGENAHFVVSDLSGIRRCLFVVEVEQAGNKPVLHFQKLEHNDLRTALSGVGVHVHIKVLVALAHTTAIPLNIIPRTLRHINVMDIRGIVLEVHAHPHCLCRTK